MPFYELKKIANNSLQTQKNKQNALSDSNMIPKSFKRKKRASRPALPGNMTVEAALVMPVFLFAMINVLSMILMFQTFSVEEGRLHQAGRELAMLAYGQEEGEQDIRLVKPSLIRAPVRVAAFPTATIVNGCVMHKWIGYDLSPESVQGEEEKEDMVYITQSGTAYHRERNCVYLNPSIRMMGREQAQEAVNQDKIRYTACEICANDSPVVYVTQDGIRYHSTVSCSGLRRTIDCVTLQEAVGAGRHACPRCG